ncbi:MULTISPECIES: NADPH-dependent FMN reductase [Cytobacillus]|uniref:NAD(P)H-dependent oxidoreductase n=1 Tax=Cytobacillus stercorigallinarum TaxID=2762240 RepID=A0ABR8QLM2_9BACI|nr:NAD(P)H-dependent oxidoreductase [Cytobacillus stercorigallinarum]MBD7936372.1 NAD(P)H-dependent oxidoreductase [Cytobacillus stercorigallinarum]
MRLLGISGTITGSKTLVVVNKVLDEIQTIHPEIEVELLDLKNFDIQFCDGRHPSEYNDDTKQLIETISSADFYVIGSPIFQGSITGVLKNLFDLVPPDVFRNKVMGFIATGGTYQHYLVIENQLKPIAGYFRAYVAPSYVYAHIDHFNHKNELFDKDVLSRVKNLANELVYMNQALYKVPFIK